MKQMMVDTETLGVGVLPALLQVGAVVYDPEARGSGVIDTFEVNVSIESCLKLGGEVEDGALRWWLGQSVEARSAVQRPGVDVGTAILMLGHFYAKHQPETVWSHGATFDLPILTGYYQRVGFGRAFTPWWGYGDARDTRTLFDLAQRLAGWERTKRETAHTALADAISQAVDVQEAYAALREVARG